MMKVPAKYKGILTQNEYSQYFEELMCLLDRYSNGDIAKRELILRIGDFGFSDAYEKLRPYLKTNLRHQALIAMGQINYFGTLDILVQFFKRTLLNDIGRLIETINTASCIMTERIDSVGWEAFLMDLHCLQPLDRLTRMKFYNAVREGAKLSYTDDAEPYVAKAKEILIL